MLDPAGCACPSDRKCMRTSGACLTCRFVHDVCLYIHDCFSEIIQNGLTLNCLGVKSLPRDCMKTYR